MRRLGAGTKTIVLIGIFPEVVNFAVGIGNKVGDVAEAEVILQDVDDDVLKAAVAREGCVFEIVLTIAIGVVEELAFRGAAEAVGLGHCLEVDDCDALIHRAALRLVAANGDVHIFFGAGLADVGGDIASLGGEGDALKVVGEGQADDFGNGAVGWCGAADLVALGDHRLWSLVRALPSTSLMISWVMSGRFHLMVSSVSFGPQ